MERLFTYTIPFDDGAAQNPFHGMCSLAICKPAIRRVAKAGDWVAGLGSKNAPSGDLSKRLGDCIYDFCKAETPIQRNSGQENIDTDLRSKHVLISKDFYY